MVAVCGRRKKYKTGTRNGPEEDLYRQYCLSTESRVVGNGVKTGKKDVDILPDE